MKSILKQILPLSFVLGARFFGLFVVMPMLALFALSMPDSNSILIGTAIGIYALSQVILQLPFGALSDKFGRKKIIAAGLVIFVAGSVVCALSDSIYMLIFGRFLQGAGAIGGVVSAMIADLVREESRAKSMAVMGGCISASFSAAMVLGPILGGIFGVGALFWLTFALGVLALFVLAFVPNAPRCSYRFSADSTSYWHILKNRNLQIMNLSNFLQKGMMSLAFLIVPLSLVRGFEWGNDELFKIFIPATLCGILAMGPSAILAEKHGLFKVVMGFGIASFALAYMLLLSGAEAVFCAGVIVFFIAFSIHEPIMQSLASRYCKAHQKGSAMGVFTSFGYLGSFVGAYVGGHMFGSVGLFALCAAVVVLCVLWLLVLYFLSNPSLQKNLYLELKTLSSAAIARLESITEIGGVLEYYINESEQIAVVKYDRTLLNEEKIYEFLNNSIESGNKNSPNAVDSIKTIESEKEANVITEKSAQSS